MRILVSDFSLSNEIYAGATVTLYTVDVNGVKTTTKVTLYESLVGSTALGNPQSLDADGKFAQPVYIEEAAIAVITGLSVADHETGVFGPEIDWKGDWTTATIYSVNDVVAISSAEDAAAPGNLYICNTRHTAGTFATDRDTNSYWDLFVDVSLVILWATKTGATVDGSDYSAKEHAVGTTVPAGSAQQWATEVEDTVVAGGLFSALHYAAKAAASAVSAAASAASAAAVVAVHAALTATHGVTGAILGTTDTQTLTNKTIDDFTNEVGADRVHIKVRNVSGGTLTAGTIIKATGYNLGQDCIEVTATVATTDVALGALSDDLNNNENGHATNTGVINDVDTSSFGLGTILYSGASGAFTDTRPASPFQTIGYVLRSDSVNGRLYVEFTEPNTALLTDESRTLSKGMLGSSGSLGNLSAATTLHISDGNFQHATVTGSFTLTAPDDADEGYIELKLNMDATGGYTVTLSGFDTVSGTLDTGVSAKNALLITKDSGETNVDIVQRTA